MKHLVIYCHPNPQSFNHAIQETYVNSLKKKNHEVKIRNLYELKFQPVLGSEDFVAMQKGSKLKDVEAEQALISWAEMITFISPIWWAGLPAMLKGFVDRVFTHGFAYTIDASGVKGLLKGKKAFIINTTGTPEEMYSASGMLKSLTQTMSAGIFQFCGLEVVGQKFFGGVPSVSDEVRKKMLGEVERLASEISG